MKQLTFPSFCFFILMFFLLSSCDPLKPGYKECEEDSHTSYNFSLPFYYAPNTDTIQLGDTLWIESKFSDQLYNEHNGKTITLNDFKFSIYGGLDDLSTSPTVPYTNFYVVDTAGKIDTTVKEGISINVKYSYGSNIYYWKKGIVLNKKGAFYIGLGTELNSNILIKTGQSITNCPNEYVTIRCRPMNVTNNYYLVKTSPDPYAQQGEEAYKNCFIFYVKE